MDQTPLTEIVSYEAGEGSTSAAKRQVPGQPGKFVIIMSAGQISLVYGPVSEFPYHADLVKRFCDQNNIPSGWLKTPDVYEIYGDTYEVRGGGWIEAGSQNGELKFYGFSTTYGGFNREDILYLYRDHVGKGELTLIFES